MHSSSKQEQLRKLLQVQNIQLQHTFLFDRRSALLALTRLHNRHYLETLYRQLPTPFLYTSGWQKALSLYFSTSGPQPPTGISDEILDAWASATLQACSLLAQSEHILDYCETGFLRMQQGNDAHFNVWVASKKMPTEWREREDLSTWENMFAQTYASERDALQSEKTRIQPQLIQAVKQWNGQMDDLYITTRAVDHFYRRLGMLHVKSMVPYNTYPSSVAIGGCTFQVYRDVLSVLVSLALKFLDCCVLLPRKNSVRVAPFCSDVSLLGTIATTLSIDATTVRLALDAYTLDAENVSYHCSAVDVPGAPLIRLDEQHRLLSFAGLLTKPLFFLMRELKRRYSYEYHTASQLREEIFRQDVYRLFADKRFVKSIGHIELRGTKGTLTTDVDALIFDRKTGALALFELKSHDPFAYSRQERIRQHDNFYAAGKQVVAALEWVKRNGANALLGRLDSKQVKHLKAHKMYVFVLGRYLAHFFEGSEHDFRAAWGTWAQVLQLVNGKAFEPDESNPIQSLFNKLVKDTPLALPDKICAVQEIAIGDQRICVYPSFEAYKNTL